MIAGRTGALIQVVAALIVTVVLLGAIELAAGLMVGKRDESALPPEIPGDTVSRTLTYLDVNPAPLVRDVDLLWRNEPGARKTQPINPQMYGRHDSWTIENNSDGFRGPERLPVDTPDVYRVVCIGDSVTFGFNVDQPAAYPAQLQNLLAARHPGRRFEVVNAAVPGWTWVQGLRFLDLQALSLRPAAIVMGHGTNDQFLPAKMTDEERFHRLAGPVARTVQAFGVWLARTNTYRAVERVFPPPPFSPDTESPQCQEQTRRTGGCHRVSLEQIAAAVDEVATATQRHGVDLVLVNLDFVRTPAFGAVQGTADRRKIPFVNIVEVVAGLRGRDEAARAARLGLAPASGHAVDPKRPAETRRVVFRVEVPDRDAAYVVRGQPYLQPGTKGFSAPLHDDGAGGDERSGDGVFSATVDVPQTPRAVEYLFLRNDEPEFKPLPPLSSTIGDRIVATADETIAPVDAFGQSYLMAERAHPNRDGALEAAKVVADAVERLPSFRRFVGAAAGS